jgi:hypothetical protein
MPAKTATAKPATLSEVFNQVEALLKRYAPPFESGATYKVGSKRHYDLLSRKEVVIDGRKRTELYFASVIEQKGYVGFYFSVPPALQPKVSPRLQKTLKGRSCFHITSLEGELLADIKSALDLGLKHYRSQGWV